MRVQWLRYPVSTARSVSVDCGTVCQSVLPCWVLWLVSSGWCKFLIPFGKWRILTTFQLWLVQGLFGSSYYRWSLMMMTILIHFIWCYRRLEFLSFVCWSINVVMLIYGLTPLERNVNRPDLWLDVHKSGYTMTLTCPIVGSIRLTVFLFSSLLTFLLIVWRLPRQPASADAHCENYSKTSKHLLILCDHSCEKVLYAANIKVHSIEAPGV